MVMLMAPSGVTNRIAKQRLALSLQKASAKASALLLTPPPVLNRFYTLAELI